MKLNDALKAAIDGKRIRQAAWARCQFVEWSGYRFIYHASRYHSEPAAGIFESKLLPWEICEEPKPKVRKEFFQWKVKYTSVSEITICDRLLSEDDYLTNGLLFIWHGLEWKEKLSDTPAHVELDWQHG